MHIIPLLTLRWRYIGVTTMQSLKESLQTNFLIGQMAHQLILPINSNIYLKKEEICIFYEIQILKPFLKQHYNPTIHKLQRIQVFIPWSDVILFLPLLPLGQNQKDQQIDEQKFEADAWGLFNTVFNQNGWNQFATFLTQHAANPDYSNKQPQQLTWVLVMRMLRNIIAHEKNLNWTGLMTCLDEVILFTSSRTNFRSLIATYEESLL